VTSAEHVFIHDGPTGKSYKIHARDARRMTRDEIEAYNDRPFHNDPSPAEIAERTAAVRSRWSPKEERSRWMFRRLPAVEIML
jgi:hypothetical protein